MTAHVGLTKFSESAKIGGDSDLSSGSHVFTGAKS